LHPVCKILLPVAFFAVLIGGCETPDVKTPEVIGEKKRTNIIVGSEARDAIDKLHGLNVATQKNLIAEYGDEQKDLLYISIFENSGQAGKALELMTRKIAHSKNGPFFHVMRLKDYSGDAFITLGMGATHYIFQSERSLIWFQTYQNLGPEIPEVLLNIYPVGTGL
jgi:hypothetical protein